MYKQLRSESLRAVLPRIIVCAVLAIALLAVSGGGLLKLMLGPKPLEGASEGDYVSFDASEVIVAVASLTSNSSDGDSRTIKTYYLLPAGDGTYMAVMDGKERNASLLDRAMDQSHEYYLGDLETLTPLGSVRGTVKELEEGMTDYMTDCIDNYQLPGYEAGKDSAALVVPYQVDLDYAGFLRTPVALGLGIAGLAVLLLGIVQLLVACLGCYQKKLRDVVTAEDADAAFAAAKKIERVRVGRYIWYSKGPGSRALDTAQVVWGYAMPEPMVVSKYRWPVALYDREQKLTRVTFMEQKHCQEFLQAIADQGSPFLMGYTSEYSEKFQADFDAFVRMAEKESTERMV